MSRRRLPSAGIRISPNVAAPRTALAPARRWLIDQMLGADHRTVAHDERALDDVLQLANVARPAVRAEHRDAHRDPIWRRGVACRRAVSARR